MISSFGACGKETHQGWDHVAKEASYVRASKKPKNTVQDPLVPSRVPAIAPTQAYLQNIPQLFRSPQTGDHVLSTVHFQSLSRCSDSSLSFQPNSLNNLCIYFSSIYLVSSRDFSAQKLDHFCFLCLYLQLIILLILVYFFICLCNLCVCVCF